MPRQTKAVVYWLFDSTCDDPRQHGYVGVTVSWPRRLWRHRCESAAFLPAEFEGRLLFEGSVKKCLAFEKELRPVAGVGWNRLPGGLGGHAMKGVSKSPEQKEKMRQAALRRYANPKERERLSRDVKRGFEQKGTDRSGANNHRFGTHQSEETKQRIRDAIAARGGVSGENNPNYRHGNYCGD